MKISVFALYGSLACGYTYGANLNADIYGHTLSITENTTVYPGSWIYVDQIQFNTSAYLINNGVIHANIYICPMCDAYIQNNGNITGNITSGQNATLTQVVTSDTSIKYLDITGSYNLLLYNAANITWSDVTDIGRTADKIVLFNSRINFDGITIARNATKIELIGENEIVLSQSDIIPNTPLLTNIVGDGTIRISSYNLNPIYAITATIQDGALYAFVRRETDYNKILDRSIGTFLNSLRSKDNSDKLLKALDNASSIEEIKHILHKSMRINTQGLNRFWQLINYHMLSSTHFDNSQPIYIEPFEFLGSGTNASGISAGLNLHLSNNISATISAHSGRIQFTDSIDDFSAKFIGIQTHLQHSGHRIFAQAQIGFNIGHTETPAIYNNSDIAKYNPTGKSAYTEINIGPKITPTQNISIIPIIGIGWEYINTIKSQANIFERAGIIISYEHQTTDIVYKYSINTSGNNRGIGNTTFKIDMSFPNDAASVYIATGFLYTKTESSVTASAGLSFNF